MVEVDELPARLIVLVERKYLGQKFVRDVCCAVSCEGAVGDAVPAPFWVVANVLAERRNGGFFACGGWGNRT